MTALPYHLEATFIGGPAHGLKFFVSDQSSFEANSEDGSRVSYLRHEATVDGERRVVYALSTLSQEELDQAVLALYGRPSP